MLIKDGNLKFCCKLPALLIVTVAGMRAGTGSTYNNDIGILGTNLVIYELETLLKLRGNLLLITKTQILEVEGLRMTGIGTNLTPLGVCRTVSPLNQVKCLIGPLLHFLHGDCILSLCTHIPTAVGALATYAARQDGQRLHAGILAELEILKVSHLHALMVTPGILDTLTGLLGTYGCLPAVCIPESVTTAVNHATAGESHELGIQVNQCLSKVLTQTMALISILRIEGYHIDIHHAGGE